MVQIDEKSHIELPTTRERAINALSGVLLGFLLFQLIGFWIFPGPGLFAVVPLLNAAGLSHLNDIITLLFAAFLAICGAYGWFRGKQFIKRLKRYLSYWRFW